MYNRTNLLNDILIAFGGKSYLEIGINSPKRNFDKINVECKIGVDPDKKAKATICKTSDDFFKSNKKMFDLIFIDGLHHCDQVLKDIENSLNFLNPNGTIVLHDCNPQEEIHQVIPQNSVHWNGDVWKAWVDVRNSFDGLECFVVDIDEGCGVIRRNDNFKKYDFIVDLTWINLVKYRKELLNLISLNEFKDYLKNISKN